jgi:pantoate--beta-alanine ligase
MGALHEGHAKLIEQSVSQNAVTVVSVFVNPKQFGPNEDLSKYPRTFESDLSLCEREGVQILFAPQADNLYPDTFRTSVSVSGMDKVLCGSHRPGHFDGVTTVVLLLLNLVNADRAYFGLKDFQQFSILKRMVEDLAHPTQLIPVSTVRESDGLALSSRNRFLDASAREIARRIPTALRVVAAMYLQGERATKKLLDAASKCLRNQNSLELQYCELRRVSDLSECGEELDVDSVLAVAALVRGSDGVSTRLIDNLLLSAAADNSEELKIFASTMTSES